LLSLLGVPAEIESMSRTVRVPRNMVGFRKDSKSLARKSGQSRSQLLGPYVDPANFGMPHLQTREIVHSQGHTGPIEILGRNRRHRTTGRMRHLSAANAPCFYLAM